MLSLTGTPLCGQVLADPLEEVGDETYTGFSTGNWVDAANFGFANHAGPEAFLSNYTGPTLVNIGMEKPLSATIGNSSYRVSFYYSRYSSVNTVPFASYHYLYIGSPDGTMVWDTVPTPTATGEWVKWSGTFTPAPGDIGQPFRLGFSLDLATQTSLAMDGPLEIWDLTTTVPEITSVNDLQVLCVLGSDQVRVRCQQPVIQAAVYDALGRHLRVDAKSIADGCELDVSHLPPGHYSVEGFGTDGLIGKGHFIVL